ncbi:hypothetical protein Q8A73_003234 [Channa argus]|nr:hypothetical protein Q8A73_003234 [Channa argus]
MKAPNQWGGMFRYNPLPYGRTATDPTSQLVPTAQDLSRALGPGLDLSITSPSPLSTSSTVPVVTGLLRGLLLSCYPHITACREEGRDKGMRGRERRGRGGICAAPTKRRLLER